MQSGIAGQVLIGQRSSAGPSNAAPREAPLIGRFVAKLVVDVLPAALASLVGGFLFTQYQHARTVAAQPTTEQVTPASPEMMRLVRDEHDAIIDYLKAQTALEKSRATAAEEVDDVHAAADAKAAAAATAAAGRRCRRRSQWRRWSTRRRRRPPSLRRLRSPWLFLLRRHPTRCWPRPSTSRTMCCTPRSTRCR